MFAGFGTITGGAHTAGQDGDRSSFQLVINTKTIYFPSQCRANVELMGRKQRNGKLVNLAQKAKQNYRTPKHA
jgi:hypothetical protein